MTENGSFPGRPRGRRARPDSESPEWAGFEATPEEQREFPDLAPIRPREARARDGRVQGEWWQTGQGQPGAAQPGAGQPGAAQPAQGAGGYGTGPSYQQPGAGYQPPAAGYQQPGGGYPQPGAGFPGTAPSQDMQPQPWSPPGYPQGYQQSQGFPGQSSTAGLGGQASGGQGPGGQAPGGQAAGAQAAAGQAQSGRHAAAGRTATDTWAGGPDEGDPMAAFSERWQRRGEATREDVRYGRRKRRWMMFTGAGAAVVAIALVVYFTIGGGGSSANLGLGSLVTSFLPGELQQVPNACTSVPNAMLTQYLPGTLKQAAPPLNVGANTECTWTLDHHPVYRVLEVNLQAYSPSGLASGDGSATFAAEDAYAETQATELKPGPKSGQPPAKVSDLAGLPGGSDTSAFIATKVFTVNGATTDVATVVVRYRNVLVTVVMNGLDHASKGPSYGPVSMSDLTSAAKTVAKQVTGTIVH